MTVRYVFTVGDDGHTTAIPFEEYDDTFDQVIRNVAVGTGVILICVTISAVTAGAGMPAASLIFAVAAKEGAKAAFAGAMVGGLSSSIFTGLQTGDMNEALKAGAIGASEGFKLGAIGGSIGGGASEALALHGTTAGGLTMDQVAQIQKETGYPLDVIKQLNSMEQFDILKEAGLHSEMVDGRLALIRDINLDFVDEKGLTNLQRMMKGLAPLDPETGLAYELHHIGQQPNSSLAILTQAEHRLGGNYKIWHLLDTSDVTHGSEWARQTRAFWKYIAQLYG